jgi:hypothetical protein
MLVEELARGLHPFDGWDLLVKLEVIHTHMDRIEGECATEARQLSQLVMENSNVLVDLGMLPFQDIPVIPGFYAKSKYSSYV